MRGGQHRWRAAAEKQGAGGLPDCGDAPRGFFKNGVDKSADRRVSRRMLVKRAIRANAMAKGNVQVSQQDLLVMALVVGNVKP